jgi:hypothetical protein
MYWIWALLFLFIGFLFGMAMNLMGYTHSEYMIFLPGFLFISPYIAFNFMYALFPHYIDPIINTWAFWNLVWKQKMESLWLIGLFDGFSRDTVGAKRIIPTNLVNKLEQINNKWNLQSGLRILWKPDSVMIFLNQDIRNNLWEEKVEEIMREIVELIHT